jgi:hypothetical protein
MRTLSLAKVAVLAIVVSILFTPGSVAQDSPEEPAAAQEATEEESTDEAALAQAAQNPIADMISLPFQNNVNLNVGAENKTQNVMNIQPVWPFSISENWNLITRTILPVISQPEIIPGDGRTNGIGDINFTAAFSPAKPGKIIWGAGPVILLPTASDDVLGTKKWGIGPTAVALRIQGPWVYGALLNNIWSVAGDDDRADVNQLLLQPFVNYNLRKGWYLTSAPIITANWEADSDNRWTVPIGAGFGKILRIGKQPINAQLSGYSNVERPDGAADWQIRIQIQLLFPK